MNKTPTIGNIINMAISPVFSSSVSTGIAALMLKSIDFPSPLQVIVKIKINKTTINLIKPICY
jgi:hypothetical protein